MKHNFPLRLRVFIATAVSGLIPLILAVTILHFTFINSFEEQIANQAMDIAQMAAERRDIKLAYTSDKPEQELQTIATKITTNTDAVFVVFLDMQGIRYSHPKEELIGKPFTGGDEGPALRKGESYTSSAVGISGPSIRAFVPIFDFNNNQVGAVSIGFWEPDISFILSKIYRTFYFVVPLGLVLIIFFSIFLARNIKNLIFGMEPIEIAKLLKERDAMLHSVKEGVIAVDKEARITLINQSAQQMFPPNTELIGRNIAELIPESQLPEVLTTKESQHDQQLEINGNIVLANRTPLIINGQIMGAVSTFRSLTEVNRIAEELTGVKKIVNALRARSHEFLNKLHVVSGLIQLESYDEARQYISRLTFKEQSLISFLVTNIHSSALAGLLMGKASEAVEMNVNLEINRNSSLFELPNYFDENAIVVVLGNLIENAFDAVALNKGEKLVKVDVLQDNHKILLQVFDNGSGVPKEIEEKIFTTGFTTKSNGQGLGLANVKNRIDVAKGEIACERMKEGTMFRVVIPFKLH